MRILVVDDHPMVMQGIAASLKRDGLFDKQIAEQLGLSIHAVRVHIRGIRRKRSTRRRAEREI